MMRKLKRTSQYEFSLQVKDEAFIRPPRDSQRNWLLNRAVNEFAADLAALDKVAGRFVPGVEKAVIADRTRGELADEDIMEDWQIPLMRAMAEQVTAGQGDILEIGFGRGVSATFIQERGVRSHTIVECNDSVIQRFELWRQQFPAATLHLVPGRWQDVLDQLDQYDGLFFHTYPLNEAEYLTQVMQSVTFAEHFFPTAANLLRDGGVFTYMTNEIDSLSRAHQRALLRYFRSFAVETVALTVPDDVRDTWWADAMVVVAARK